ncbi:acid-responsive two-component system sensor histidine kinase TcsA [Sinorhizobium meliloti]|uniref:acid-responsive two-component system sensor histidine kinase TcsA n=1 Tax=Rhizobium meliloti TaxID=382 RepID=UPI000410DB5B|nr:acid-responsive two-component system sensor histidine kinase TcsA [Sinorhizobium meliloti]
MISRFSSSLAAGQPALLALGFAMLAMISGTSVWLVAQTRGDSKQVMWTLTAKEKLLDLQGQVWRAESDQRGLLLTGAGRYRDAFLADIEAVKNALAEAKAALSSDAGKESRQPLVARLEAAVTAELALLEKTAAKGQNGELDRSPALGNDALVRSRAEDIRINIAQLVRHEQQLLSEAVGASQGTAHLLLIASLFGASLIIALATTSIALVRHSTSRLKTAQRALEEANESLEATVAKRTAELREASEEIQHFAHIVSHDLRSPLVNIMGFTGELEVLRKELFGRISLLTARHEVDPEPDERLAEEFDEALSFIKNSITRMDRLIKAILKLTREGRRELRLELINMTELARTTADGFSYQAQEAGALIIIDSLPSCVGDRLALEQIFANLLENALKYLRDGIPGQIHVTGRTTASEVVYEVNDNGRGIDPKDRERIFEIFRRSGPQDRPGEGIGLTYVRTLVRRLGGAITVSSGPGGGSTFTVTLPRRAAGASQEKTHD